VKSLIDQHKLDGVDIDWEYPTVSADNETGADPNDTQNFNLVLQELRETLGTGKIISFASSSSHPEYVDWATAINYIDYVNVMTYDMGAAPKGHNSPLHKGDRFTGSSWDEAVQKHEKYLVPKNRQVMGVPFYGKAEKKPAEADKVFVDSKGNLGYSIKYKDIVPVLEKGTYMGVALNRKLHRVWDTKSMVPFLADDAGRNFLSYDDPESVEAKGAYVRLNGHLGAMFWEYRGDTDDHALLKALVKGVYEKDTVL
jgi:chitinase